MKEKQITQRELSEKTGISAASISRIQNHHSSRIDFKTLNTLANYFGIESGDELFEYIIEED